MPIIVQFWSEGGPPQLFADRMLQWKQLNPEWSYRCYNRNAAAAFLRDAFDRELEDAFLDIRLPAMQADVFRVAHTLVCGGLWVDAATKCLAPVANWLDHDASLVMLRRPHMQPPRVWNGLIYSRAPRHPLLGAAWQEISEAIRSRSGTSVWHLVGPGLFERILRDGNFENDLRVLEVTELDAMLRIGSSFEALPKKLHWSKRQQRESLYFSVPSSRSRQLSSLWTLPQFRLRRFRIPNWLKRNSKS